MLEAIITTNLTIASLPGANLYIKPSSDEFVVILESRDSGYEIALYKNKNSHKVNTFILDFINLING